MIRIPPVFSRRNPLVGFERRPWERPERNRVEALFLSPKYEQQWQKALKNTDIKFRVFVAREFNFVDDIDKWRLLNSQAKKNDEVVLVITLCVDLPYIFEDPYAVIEEDEKHGRPLRISLPSPFMILHNLFEYIDHTVEKHVTKKGMQYWSGPQNLHGIDTWAGRRGILLDKQNAMADLFAKYIVTGRVAYTGPDYDQVKQVVEQAAQYLREHPGMYTFETSQSAPARDW